MFGFEIGLPGVGSASVSAYREWHGFGVDKRETDAEVYLGWLIVTLSKPRPVPGTVREVPRWMAKEKARESRLSQLLASIGPRARQPMAACLGLATVTFAGGVVASTVGTQMMTSLQRVEAGQCETVQSISNAAEWSRFTACKVGTIKPGEVHKVSGVTDDAHPIDMEATAGTTLAVVDRDLIVTGQEGMQRVKVPGVDRYEVERVYQDSKGRLVLKGYLLENRSEEVRIRFEKIEEIELGDVSISLK